MSDKWEVKPSLWRILEAGGEGVARLAGADPKPNYQGQDVKVQNRDTREEKTVHVGWGQELGDAIAKGQFIDRSPSGEDTGSSSDYSAISGASRGRFGVFLVGLLVLGVAGVILSSILGSTIDKRAADYPICADAKDQTITTTTVVRVRPDCWSGWVKLTPGTKFDLISSDEAELFYWGGSRKKLPNNRVGFLGHVPSTFSIRGKGGTVTVRIHDG